MSANSRFESAPPHTDDELEAWAEIRQEAAQLGQDAGAFVRARVRDYPVSAAAIAAGLGFAVGGGVPRSALTVLLGIGARFAASFVSEEIAAAMKSESGEA